MMMMITMMIMIMTVYLQLYSCNELKHYVQLCHTLHLPVGNTSRRYLTAMFRTACSCAVGYIVYSAEFWWIFFLRTKFITPGSSGWRSQWARVLKHGSTADRLLELRFESRRGHGCLSVVSVVCCRVEICTTGWSLIQRSPTECGVFECNREASIMRRP